MITLHQEMYTLDGGDQTPVYMIINPEQNRMTLKDKKYFYALDESDKRQMYLEQKNLIIQVEAIASIGGFEEVYYSLDVADEQT